MKHQLLAAATIAVVITGLWGCDQDKGADQSAISTTPSTTMSEKVEATSNQMMESAKDTVEETTTDMKKSASEAETLAVDQAMSLVEEVKEYLANNDFDLAGQTLEKLAGMKSMLPESLQSQIDSLQSLLTTQKAAVSADSDGDGVTDDKDKCTGTPEGARVDSDGCMEKLVLQNVQFELNSAELTAASRQTLEPIAQVLKGRPDIKGLTVKGHTDSTGSGQYNQTLSQARAESVADFFVFSGVNVTMTAKGMGESSPVADNNTAEGRANNRRVELDVMK